MSSSGNFSTPFERGPWRELILSPRRSGPYRSASYLLAAVVVHVPLLLAKLPLAFLRRDLSYFLRLPLRPSLVRSVEPQMVCRLLADHISAVAAAVGSGSLPYLRSGMAYMAVQFAAILLLALGVYRFSRLWVSRARCIVCGVGQRFSRRRELPGLFRRAIVDHICRADLSERSALSFRLDASWQVAVVSEGSRAVHRRGCGPPCHPALRLDVLCPARPGTGASGPRETASASPLRPSSRAPSRS